MDARKVTERDFRQPEFKDADPADYEFRGDGKIVRKDRWEQAIQSIRHFVGVSGREFEIEDVISAVAALVADNEWQDVEDWPGIVPPQEGDVILVRLEDGSVLNDVHHDVATKGWTWRSSPILQDVKQWKIGRSKFSEAPIIAV